MDFGPVAGIHAALECTSAEWNLIVACDMPNVTSDFVDWLLRRAEAGTADAVIPVDEEGRRHPLCAVYRKALAARLQMAIERGMRKVMLAFDGVSVDYAPAEEFREFGSSQVLLLNVNRPEDLARYR
jgi:molybdopterin-guanine dinucleotide biosynthesis protein A